MYATAWWSTTKASSTQVSATMWWVAGLMHPSTVATTAEAIVTYSKRRKIRAIQWKILQNKISPQKWIEKKRIAHHDSVDRHRANRYAFVSLVVLDPVKIYHVVDIHDSLDGVYIITNKKWMREKMLQILDTFAIA